MPETPSTLPPQESSGQPAEKHSHAGTVGIAVVAFLLLVEFGLAGIASGFRFQRDMRNSTNFMDRPLAMLFAPAEKLAEVLPVYKRFFVWEFLLMMPDVQDGEP